MASNGGEPVIYRSSDGSHYEKRGKGEPVCIDDEIPLEIPESWAWTRLESCCRAVIDCPHSTPSYLADDTGFYAIDTNCIDEAWNQTGLRYLSKTSYEKRVSRYAPRPGDLVLSREGSIGRSVILKQENVCLGQRVMVLGFFEDGLLNRYCQLVLTSPYAWTLYMAANVGTGVKHINVSMIKDIPIPLPPRSEQIRIIEMIESLQPHVNEYGALEDARERLAAELPDRLRKSILQLAVQGKLVSQDPNDEPASALLDRIRAERAALVKAKKLKSPKGGESVIYRASDGGYYEKRGKDEPICIDDEIPFEIPESWVWARMSTLCDFGKCVNVEYDAVAPGTWNLDLEDLEKDSGHILQKKRKQEGEKGSTKHAFSAGMVLYSKLRPYLNKVAIADEDGVCTSEILPLRFSGVTSEFAQIVLMAPLFVDYAKAHSYGVKMPRLGTTDGASFLVPVPPSQEQMRIVEAVRNYQSLTNR